MMKVKMILKFDAPQAEIPNDFENRLENLLQGLLSTAYLQAGPEHGIEIDLVDGSHFMVLTPDEKVIAVLEMKGEARNVV